MPVFFFLNQTLPHFQERVLRRDQSLAVLDVLGRCGVFMGDVQEKRLLHVYLLLGMCELSAGQVGEEMLIPNRSNFERFEF